VVANVPASLLAAYPGCMLGTALMEAGELDRGQAELLIAAGGPDLPELEPWGRAYWYEILVRAELAQDRVAQADAWVARAEDAAERFPSSSRTAVALRARAALLLARGDGGASAGLAAEAARGFELPGWRLEAALTRALLGRALEAAGERKRAVHELERAHAGLAQCGAARSRDEVARDIRRLGHRVSRPRRRNVGGEGIDALSGREREAAELVTEGKTNREIALELFVSERTVETYLSRASAKLGVSSRAALAGAFARDHLKRSDVA